MLWLIERNDGADYDEHDSAVIRADTEERAREIAEESLSSPKGVWGIGKASCVQVSGDGPSEIVLSSFNAG